MYLTPAEAQKRYGYHPKTLTRWADEGKIQYIKSPGGHRRYLIESIEKLVDRVDQRPIILYARVSTTSQKDDLASQIEYLGKNYPNCKCINDFGSGLNFKRKKFISLMEQVSKQEIQSIVVAHKDRLCRFGFDFVEWFCNLNHCDIIVLNNTYKSPHQELMEDFMSIMHCFSSKLDFLRKYEKIIESYSEKSDTAL
ncbi:IS607 family transposase [Brasilonema bromeliae]|uniref:IS607 family transposase n=1 Tax=Brasilonema bromeliae SPC951 TaxID=385972 RepID=A0ABX1P7F4_9CYAN|nr:IS607 family transposase [Brasilonema bromeliae]NMG20352.1 IS607 family transposase [Brasilonema bromeliae SPC951]